MEYYTRSNELYHYGVLGMKWGIRRYQPYPSGYNGSGEFKDINRALKGKGRGERFTAKHVIPKGTTFYRVAPKGDPANEKSKSIYATYLGPDRDFYRGAYLNGLKGQYGDRSLKMYERKYQLKEDLNVPSKETQRAAFDKVLKEKKNAYSIGKTAIDTLIANNPAYRQDAAYEVVEKRSKKGRFMIDDNYTSEMFQKDIDKTLEKIKDNLVKEFVEGDSLHKDTKWMYSQLGLGKNGDIKQKVIAELQKQGYNAMVDYASVGGTGGFNVEGIEPVIIFDQGSSLDLKSEKKVGSRTSTYATQRYVDWKREATFTKAAKGW